MALPGSYQELLFQCDIDTSFCQEFKSIFGYFEDKLPYQLLQKMLNSKFNSYGINFGLENDTFSLGYCEGSLELDSYFAIFIWHFAGKLFEILEIIATRSIFTTDRLKLSLRIFIIKFKIYKRILMKWLNRFLLFPFMIWSRNQPWSKQKEN